MYPMKRVMQLRLPRLC